MFRLVKKCFFTGIALFSTLTSLNLLSCISITNQECKLRQQVVNVNGNDRVFSLLVSKQVNAVVVATISIIHAQNCVFLMLYVQSTARN